MGQVAVYHARGRARHRAANCRDARAQQAHIDQHIDRSHNIAPSEQLSANALDPPEHLNRCGSRGPKRGLSAFSCRTRHRGIAILVASPTAYETHFGGFRRLHNDQVG